MDARVYEQLAKCRKGPDQTDKKGQFRTPRTILVRSPSETGNRVGGVKSSRGFESHPLRSSALRALGWIGGDPDTLEPRRVRHGKNGGTTESARRLPAGPGQRPPRACAPSPERRRGGALRRLGHDPRGRRARGLGGPSPQKRGTASRPAARSRAQPRLILQRVPPAKPGRVGFFEVRLHGVLRRSPLKIRRRCKDARWVCSPTQIGLRLKQVCPTSLVGRLPQRHASGLPRP
jgi:hypothetical protein